MDIELELLETSEEARRPTKRVRAKRPPKGYVYSTPTGKRAQKKAAAKRKTHGLTGKAKSAKHKKAISAGLKKYWSSKKSSHRKRKATKKRKTTTKRKSTRAKITRRKRSTSKSPSAAAKAFAKTGKLPTQKNGGMIGSPSARSAIKKAAAKLKSKGGSTQNATSATKKVTRKPKSKTSGSTLKNGIRVSKNGTWR